MTCHIIYGAGQGIAAVRTHQCTTQAGGCRPGGYGKLRHLVRLNLIKAEPLCEGDSAGPRGESPPASPLLQELF